MGKPQKKICPRKHCTDRKDRKKTSGTNRNDLNEEENSNEGHRLEAKPFQEGTNSSSLTADDIKNYLVSSGEHYDDRFIENFDIATKLLLTSNLNDKGKALNDLRNNISNIQEKRPAQLTSDCDLNLSEYKPADVFRALFKIAADQNLKHEAPNNTSCDDKETTKRKCNSEPENLESEANLQDLNFSFEKMKATDTSEEETDIDVREDMAREKPFGKRKRAIVDIPGIGKRSRLIGDY